MNVIKLTHDDYTLILNIDHRQLKQCNALWTHLDML
jgi:hypothetical protein